MGNDDFWYTTTLLDAIKDAQVPFNYEGERCVMVQYGSKVVMVLDRDKLMKYVPVIPKSVKVES